MKILKILTLFGALALALPAHAATLALSPATVSVAPGATVTVTVSVDPQSATVAAVKTELAYPSALLTPMAFSFAPTWIPVTHSGYDQMTGGTIIKSAGYPGGLKNSATLGTITFKATAAGVAHLVVETTSAIYATDGTNALSGAQGTAVITIVSASPATTSTPATVLSAATTSPRSAAAPTVARGTQVVPRPAKARLAVAAPDSGTAAIPAAGRAPAATSTARTSAAAQVASSSALTAAAANAAGSGLLNSSWFWIVFALIVLAIIGGAVLWYRRKMRDLA